jgi:putative ABC transport system permease protein
LSRNAEGDINNIRLFSAIALVIIFITAINYIILSTAVSSGRVKEIGLKIILGSSSGKIVLSFLLENFVLTALAF